MFICHLIAFRPQGASPGTERHSKCPAINRVMVGPEGRDGGTVTHIMGKKGLLAGRVITPVVLKAITGSTEAKVSSGSRVPPQNFPCVYRH